MDEPEEMPDPYEERLRDPRGVHSEAWSGTLDDMKAIAADRREDGWSVVTVIAAHTDTVSRGMGGEDDDTFGLKHVIPDNHAEPFVETYDSDEFTEYLAYGREVEGFMYVVIELIDADTDRSILIACRYDMTQAQGMVQNAAEAGYLPTHVKRIDGTVLGRFVHEEYDPLVRPPEH